MPNPLVECIPNFSEARRPEVVQAILRAIAAAPDISILDHHADSDHNRTVVTFIGPPQAVEEAAFRGIQKAAALIDLNTHSGSHPRIGATDVVPFVPIAGVSMANCVAIARRLGERVGRELNIPVYLYEEAATRPERVNLENIRKRQYEGLKKEIRKRVRKPDYGPARLGPAGATVIGARHPLIAFNVYLDTEDVSLAKAIAKTIRQSSGGLPCVKALGMLVEGRAQVSMNLTNFRQTSLHTVVEAIRSQAARHGVSIHHSELVGLIPQEALTDAAIAALQLTNFGADQILESRLTEIEPPAINLPTFQPSNLPTCQPTTFLEDLAAATPAPGGGSAAAYAGALAAALVAMVARLTIGKKKYASVEAQMTEILNQAEKLRADLTAAVDEDSAAFEGVMAAFKLTTETAGQETLRNQAIEEATKTAAQIPLKVAQKAVTVMALAERAAALGNLNAITDAASAAALARAALSAAGYNVRINVASLNDRVAGDSFLNQLHAHEERAASLEKAIQKTLNERGRLSLT
ncbi:MAG: glutamate formimidoyltransferase [Anaerolineales bacterium]|nr:glutamate formimidoyltransferase [Anaerolineales bacterium]